MSDKPEGVHLDFETRSDADIKRTGQWRYAMDPSTRILMFAIARGDEEPVLWVNPEYDLPEMVGLRDNEEAATLLFEALEDPDAPIYAHNAGFELAILASRLRLDVATALDYIPSVCGLIPKMRCTAAMGRKANLPPSLEKLGEALEITEAKNPAGKRLITRYSVKHEPATKKPEYWEQFCNYCIQDVRAEREIHKTLHQFELTGTDLEVFHFDMRLNYLGIPVDVEALKKANALVSHIQTTAAEKFKKLTGLNPTQNAKITEYLGLENLQKATLDKIELDTVDDSNHVQAIKLLRDIKFAAVAKIPAMLACVCEDGRIRDTFKWYGASNTGRWSGQRIQPQNFKNPPYELKWAVEYIYDMVAEGCEAEDLELFFAPALECLASIIRQFIRLPDGPMLDADYSAIEARIAAWLAGQKDRLELFRKGEDIYLHSAKSVGQEGERQLGKVLELAFGYQGGDGAWRVACETFNMPYIKEEGEKFKNAWREANTEIVSCWHKLQNCAIRAIEVPGKWVKVNNKIRIGCGRYADLNYMVIELPSKRKLMYPKPQIGQGKYGPEITYWGKETGKAYFGRVKLYGGKLFENCLAEGTLVKTDSGWKPIEEVRLEDRVFDGVEYVTHDGVVAKGAQPCVKLNGVWATPDHRFRTAEGWEAAEKACLYDKILQTSPHAKTGFIGSEVWPTVSQRFLPSRWQEVPLESHLRLWERIREGGIRVTEKNAEWLLTPMSSVKEGSRGEEQETRFKQTPHTLSVAHDDTAVPKPELESLPQLWGQGHPSVQEVAEVRELLEGYDAYVEGRVDVRQDKQRGALHAEELPMGNLQGAGPEHPQQQNTGVGTGLSRPARRRQEYDVLPPVSGSFFQESGNPETRPYKKVYDILNCGPRHQFAVKAKESYMIAHNCCQAAAYDFMAYGALSADKEGFNIFALIHDQALSEKETNQTPEAFSKALSTLPDWGKGMPLTAEAEEVMYYTKN